MAIKNYAKHEYAMEKVMQAFDNLGIALTEENIKKEISGYAAENFKETGTLTESFAEILSGQRKGKLYKELIRLIKED